ncbi:MAG: sulfatase-like hydrolase/transferase [Verrucomicrobiota bacterium]
MNSRSWSLGFRLRAVWAVLVLAGFWADRSMVAEQRPPTVVLIYCDDLGWGDLGCFGAAKIRTPNIDRLAKQGTRFTSFYVAQAVCSASRAALLTGCYANRLGIHGALGPKQKIGLHPDEMTLAEVLKPRGYATAMFGKWHLGRPKEFLPTRQGFDEYFGLPYSNDMWPNHPSAAKGTYPPLPLIEGDRVIEEMPDQSQLTHRYTERAVSFIERNSRSPFFLYLAHSMPHVPIFASSRFAGRSRQGLYGDVIEEIDWSVGEVMRALKRHRLEDNTLVIFTSDNGPWLSYGEHGGSAGPFREGKGTSFEGGIRVPCVMRWPGHIPKGRTNDTPLMTIDVLPTVARLAGADLPPRKIDGLDVWPILRGDRVTTHPHRAYFIYYNQGDLLAVRSGDCKLFFPHTSQTLAGKPGGTQGLPASYQRLAVGTELYNLRQDPAETSNVIDQHPAVVAGLTALAEEAREELGDQRLKRVGSGVREPGRVE